MAVWMYFGLAYTITFIWVLFYAESNIYYYYPKKQRFRARLTQYLAYLHAWKSAIWFRIMLRMKHSQQNKECKRRRDIAGKYRQSNSQLQSHVCGSNDITMPPTILTRQVLLALETMMNKVERLAVIDSDSRILGIDNRASAYLSGFIEDFVGELHPTTRVIKGFMDARATNVSTGTAKIRLESDSGKVQDFVLHNSYYVPGCGVRLFSPQHWAQQLKRQRRGPAQSTTYHDRVVLTTKDFVKTIPLDPATNVATCRTAPGYSKFVAFCLEAGFDDDESDNVLAYDAQVISDDEDDDPADFSTLNDNVSDDNLNVNNTLDMVDNLLGPTSTPSPTSHRIVDETEVERDERKLETELLAYHLRFAHVSFRKLQIMARYSIIPRRLATCRIPVCAACMFGKATKRQWRQKSPLNKDEAYVPTKPGEVVSVDQMKSPTPGFIAQMTGILTTKRYEYATVFVDSYSSFGFVYLQKTASADETIEGKHAFERLCQQNGIRVQHYHADNGIFKANKWVNDCQKCGQGLTFAGVNAHHQNGQAEARIRRLQELTRTQLAHAKRKWPQEISANLWPYALRIANDANNATPNLADKPEYRSPAELFYGTKVSTNAKRWQHFGCPVYVLDKNLQANKPLHKWVTRARVGVYLGRSPHHSRSIALVLDIKTGLVSPQFHIKMDPEFDTIAQLYQAAENASKQQSLWQIKAGLVSQSQTNVTTPKQGNATTMASKRIQVNKELSPSGDGTSVPEGAYVAPPEPRTVDMSTTTDTDNGSPTNTESEIPGNDQTGSNTQQEKSPRKQATSDKAIRRSKRRVRPAQRLIEAMTTELAHQCDVPGEVFSIQAMFPNDDMPIDEDLNPLYAYKAKADPDTLYLHEAQKESDWEQFSEAMELEIKQQVDMGVYTIMLLSEVPEGTTVLPAVWQLRRKRDIRTGVIKKYKARCNIDGSRMRHGEHYDQTYAPVAGWPSIRLLLALVLLFNWRTVQLDYVLAYPHAPADRDLYMKLPKGFTIAGVEDPTKYCLKVNRNLYGGKSASRIWFQYLRKRLIEKCHFVQSKHDECVFYKGNMIYVLYTDDSILAGPDQAEIERTIQLMKDANLNITIEGDLTDFLGVNIDRKDDGTIHLTQPKLIEQVISDLRMQNDNVKTKTTPMMSSKLLSRHLSSTPFDASFDYRSVIGKLNYIERGSRPDIAYAVHQCARFSIDPKREHGDAIRWIARYLRGTRDKGIVLKADSTRGLEVYVDADFAGNWDKELAGFDKDTARSRHGYVICYAGVPVTWKSQLQQEIALSSCESEITGLSYALREAIPIIELLREMKRHGFNVHFDKAHITCKVYEDNMGAIEIARTPKARPRTKHINNRLFHFYDYVERGDIEIHHIPSEDQPADILTKALSEPLFVKHRQVIMGW